MNKTDIIDLTLIHDGKFWVAENKSLAAKGETLEELDRELGRICRADEKLGLNKRLRFRMTFDNMVIPEWIRQYSNHYFNRIVTINLH